MVDGVASFAKFLRPRLFRGHCVGPRHRRKVGEEVGPQPDGMPTHERAALVAPQVVGIADERIEPRRADVETGLPGLRVTVLPDEAAVATDRRIEFHHVDAVVQPSRAAADSAGKRHGWQVIHEMQGPIRQQ